MSRKPLTCTVFTSTAPAQPSMELTPLTGSLQKTSSLTCAQAALKLTPVPVGEPMPEPLLELEQLPRLSASAS